LKDVVFRDRLRIEKVKMDEVEPLKAEIESFVNAARTGVEPVATGERGVRAMRAAMMITEKIRAHSWGEA
jgi:predicted dehydrogenase